MLKTKVVHTFSKKKPKPTVISLRKHIGKRFIFLICFFLMLLILNSFLVYTSICNQAYDYMSNVLKIYDNQVTQNFSGISKFLIGINYKNTDVSALAVSGIPDNYSYVPRIKKAIATGVYSNPYIDGMFVYSKKHDLCITEMNNFYTNFNNTTVDYKCLNYLREQLKEEDSLPFSTWFVVNISSDYYFVNITKQNSMYTGAWVNLKHLGSYFQYFNKMNSELIYADKDGKIINGGDLYSDIAVSSDNKIHVNTIENKRYFAVSCPLSFSEYFILTLVPASNFFDLISPIYYSLVVVTIGSILLLFLALLIGNKYFRAPVQMLTPVISAIKEGDFNKKVETDSNFSEIVEITTIFNEMIDEIKNLRINIYEENIKTQELELQYLKSQLAPHFLINCLNTIFVLSEDKVNKTILHEVINTLSEHLRYTLSSRTSVSLKEEMHYVENYLILTQLRFPSALIYSIDVEEGAEEASVFPMLVLLIAENSIKNNVVMGETLSIEIKAKICREGNEARLNISCIDSGSGFSQKDIEIYNNIDKHSEVSKYGHHIGINNIFSRLKLISGETASIKLSNEPGKGARIDINLPYEIYTPEEPKEEI